MSLAKLKELLKSAEQRGQEQEQRRTCQRAPVTTTPPAATVIYTRTPLTPKN